MRPRSLRSAQSGKKSPEEVIQNPISRSVKESYKHLLSYSASERWLAGVWAPAVYAVPAETLCYQRWPTLEPGSRYRSEEETQEAKNYQYTYCRQIINIIYSNTIAQNWFVLKTCFNIAIDKVRLTSKYNFSKYNFDINKLTLIKWN